MNISDERALFETIIGGVPAPAKGRLLAEFERLAAMHADPSVADQPGVETEISRLQRMAALMSGQAPADRKRLHALIALVLVLFFAGLVTYFAALGPDRFVLIETTRPVLVFTLIIAMLGFGGALIFTALFSSEGISEFEKRFRLGREIFLVYSGIFGTIIGFYFGAASGEAASADPPSVTAVSVQADGMLAAQVEGGSSPFTGTIRLNGEDDDRSLIVSGNDVSIRLNPALDCPAGAQLTIRDSQSQSAELTVPDTAANLVDQGWGGCRDEAAGEQEVGNGLSAPDALNATTFGNAG